MQCRSEPGVVADGRPRPPRERPACAAERPVASLARQGRRRNAAPADGPCLERIGRFAREPRLARAAGVACLLALALLASPRAEAQTEIWSATLTPQDTGNNVFGCDNDEIDTAAQCSNTSVLSDDDFTVGTTDHSIKFLVNQAGIYLQFRVFPALTNGDTLTLVVGTTSLAFSDADFVGEETLWIWENTGLSWTAGTDVSLRLLANTAPGVPTGITATANGHSRIDLAWTAPVDTGGSAITGYRIEVSSGGDSWTDLVANTGSTATAYAHMGLNARTTRYYRVSAINAVGTSNPSHSDGATTEAEPSLVSNLGSASTTAIRLGAASDSKDAVQLFTTGTNPGGYTLTGIGLNLHRAGGVDVAPAAVKVHEVTVTGTAVTLVGTPVATLTFSGTGIAAGVETFTTSIDTPLDPSTTYGVFVEATGAGSYWDQATTGAEDATPAAGWSIGDQAATRAHNSTGAFTLGSAGPGMIRVNGVVGTNAPPTGADKTVATGEDRPYTFAAADFGFADTDDGDVLASVRIVTLPGVGRLALDGTAVVANDAVTKTDIDDDKLTFRPAQRCARRPLYDLHLQGERRHGRQHRRLHDDHRRDGRPRPRLHGAQLRRPARDLDRHGDGGAVRIKFVWTHYWLRIRRR